MSGITNETSPRFSGRPAATAEPTTAEQIAPGVVKVTCPCGSGLGFKVCCAPRLDGTNPPRTPVELLRARFCAYCFGVYDYLVDTHLPPEGEDKISAEELAEQLVDVSWERLDILGEGHDEDLDCPYVDFRAFYDMPDGRRVLAERSFFREVDGAWFYVAGEPLKGESVRREHPKVGRNDPCPCGSGKKYKKCCGRNV